MFRFALIILAGLMVSGLPTRAQVTEGDDAPMRVGRFEHNGKVYYGHLSVGGVHQLDGDYLDSKTRVTGKVFPLAQIKLLAPMAPGRVFFTQVEFDKRGRSYLSRAKFVLRENAKLLASGEEVAALSDGQKYRFAPQLVIVIGEKGDKIKEKRADDIIVGVSIGNVLVKLDDKKNIVGAPIAVLGPWVVPGLSNNRLRMQVKVNGKTLRGLARKHLLFPVERIVARISQQIALEPGDTIFTGAKLFRREVVNGDEIEIVLEGIGTLTSPIGK